MYYFYKSHYISITQALICVRGDRERQEGWRDYLGICTNAFDPIMATAYIPPGLGGVAE